MTLRVIQGQDAPEPLIDRFKMARLLDVHVATLDRMVARNEIPSVRLSRRTRRFQASLVMAHLMRAQTKDAA